MVDRLMMLALVLALSAGAEAAFRRCFVCRSRTDLGTCKDPFTYNSTQSEVVRGVHAIPCASGWCGKILEGGNTYKDDDYGIATQRMCLQRSPSDSEERCAYTVYNYKKVYMCFCIGDLCNSSLMNLTNWYNLVVCMTALFYIKKLLSDV